MLLVQVLLDFANADLAVLDAFENVVYERKLVEITLSVMIPLPTCFFLVTFE